MISDLFEGAQIHGPGTILRTMELRLTLTRICVRAVFMTIRPLFRCLAAHKWTSLTSTPLRLIVCVVGLFIAFGLLSAPLGHYGSWLAFFWVALFIPSIVTVICLTPDWRRPSSKGGLS